MIIANLTADQEQADAARRLNSRMEAQHQEYEESRHILEQIAANLIEVCRDTCVDGGIVIKDLRKRVKEWDQIRRKVESGGAKDWRSTKDLIGIRLVVLSPSEASAAQYAFRGLSADGILNNWHWDLSWGRSRGYQGSHIQLSLPDETGNPQVEGVKVAELQVMTALEDTWDTLTHDKFYKSNGGVTSEDRKRVFRLAALMNLVDHEIRELTKSVSSGAETAWKRVNENTWRDHVWRTLDLDEVTLGAAASSVLKPKFASLRELGRQAQFRVSAWPESIRIGLETDSFFEVADAAKIRTLGDLERSCDEADTCLLQLKELRRIVHEMDGAELRLFDRPLTVLSATIMLKNPHLGATAFLPDITRAIRRAAVTV